MRMQGDSPFAMLLAPPFGWVFATVFGALWGSFFNVAIHRLAREDARLRDVIWPPSHCPHCQARIKGYDNVPVLAWLWLRGRCRSCKAPISIRYPVVEALSAAFGAAVYYAFVMGRADAPWLLYSRFFIDFFFVGVLLVLALIDLDTMLLPEAITLPSIPLFFLLGRFLGDVSLLDAAIGAALGFSVLKGVQLGYRAATGREGLGGGDSMLMALVGGFLGWRALPFTLGLGATVGVLITLPLLVWQRRTGAAMQQAESGPDGAVQQEKLDGNAALQDENAALHNEGEAQSEGVSLRHVEVPFGPFLVIGALLYFFFKDVFWAWMLWRAERP